MDRSAVILLVFALLLAPGFFAGLIFGKPWTRWVTGVLAAWLIVMTKFAHPDEILIGVPFIVGMGALGYGAALLGIKLRAKVRAPSG